MRTKEEINSSEWFGELPEGWNMVPLSALFRFSKGLSITKADLVKTGKPVISYGQIHSKQNIGVEVRECLLRRVPNVLAGETSPSRVLSNGFVFADTSEDLEGCGNNVRNDLSHAFYGGYHTVILNPKRDFNSKYLAYLFTTDAWRFQIRRDLVDVKLFSVNQTSLNETYVVIPPTDVQKSIVSYLDERCAAIDEDVAKRREVIGKLKEYKRALIAHAVTKGLDPNVEMKASGVEWLGKVPAGWDVKRSKSCVLAHRNGNWGDDQGTSELDCICVRAADFDYEHLRFKPSQTMVKRSYTYSQFERVKLQPLDIVIEKSGGGDRTPVGRAVLYRGEFEAAYSNFMERIAVNADIALPAFFFYWWTANYQARWFVPFFNQTTGIQNLNTHNLLNGALIVLPSLSEQQRIVSYLDERCAAIDEAIAGQEQLIEKLGEYRKSVIHHAVTGKIDCTEA